MPWERMQHNRLDWTEYKDRTSALFPSTYLTSIGVIQSVYLGLLATRIFGQPLLPGWEGKTLEFGYAALGVSSALLIATEYCWFVLIFRRTTTYIDILIPYILGIFEFAPPFFIDEPTGGHYWLWGGIFATWGAVAYFHAYSYCDKAIFSDGDVKIYHLTRENIQSSMICVAIVAVAEIGVFHVYEALPRYVIFLIQALVLISTMWLLWKSRRFLLEVEDYFAKQERTSRKSPNPKS